MASVRKFDFKGMMAPTFAPLHDDGSLNVSLVPRYAQLLQDGGVTGVFINGSLGEGMSLTTEERKLVVEAWAKSRDMAGDLVVQVGGTTLKDTKELVRHAIATGVSAIACLPPLYDKPETIDDLVDYCREVACTAPDTPFLYYHIPCKTNVEFPLDKFLEAAAKKIPTLAGAKFTSNEVESEGMGCLKVAGGSLTILNGFDEMLSKSARIGFPGAICGSFNFMPLEAGRLLCLSRLADDDGATCCVPRTERLDAIYRIQDKINTLWASVRKHCCGSLVSSAKSVMKALTGLDVGPTRKPQRPLTAAATESLMADLLKQNFRVINDTDSN